MALYSNCLGVKGAHTRKPSATIYTDFIECILYCKNYIISVTVLWLLILYSFVFNSIHIFTYLWSLFELKMLLLAEYYLWKTCYLDGIHVFVSKWRLSKNLKHSFSRCSWIRSKNFAARPFWFLISVLFYKYRDSIPKLKRIG